MLDRAAEIPGHGLRLLDRSERETWLPWSEVRQRAGWVCGGLRRLGIKPGERVALIYPTGTGFFDAFFGILLAGAVPVPLYPPVRLGRLTEYHERTARMLEAVDARLVLTDRRVARILGRTIAIARPVLGCRSLDELEQSTLGPVDIAAENLALVQFSSGTTVDPKAVPLSHPALVAQTMTLNSFWPETSTERQSGVSWLPLYHDMGLIGCVLPALERPTTLTLIPPEVFVARPSVWLRAISRYRATISPAPNFAYGLCVDKISDEELEGVDLGSWKVALNGAEPVAPGVLRAFLNRFGPYGFAAEALTPVYGLSEAALAVTFSDLGRVFTTTRFDRHSLAADGTAKINSDGIELVSVGRPLPGFDIRIVDEHRKRVASNRVGRVLCRGPSLMEGYLGRPEATAQVLQDDWLDTGDLGFQHESELYLTGRAKDLLILRGRNHAPSEVEQAVDTVVGVRTGCAVAVSHLEEGADGEVLLVFVEIRNDTATDSFDNIATGCIQAILAATGLQVERVVILEPGTLPRTSSGKLRRQETLRLHVCGDLEPPNPVTPLRVAGAMAQSAVAFARLNWNNRGHKR